MQAAAAEIEHFDVGCHKRLKTRAEEEVRSAPRCRPSLLNRLSTCCEFIAAFACLRPATPKLLAVSPACHHLRPGPPPPTGSEAEGTQSGPSGRARSRRVPHRPLQVAQPGGARRGVRSVGAGPEGAHTVTTAAALISSSLRANAAERDTLPRRTPHRACPATPQAETDLEQKRTEWRAKLQLRRAEAEDLRWHVEYMQEASVLHLLLVSLSVGPSGPAAPRSGSCVCVC